MHSDASMPPSAMLCAALWLADWQYVEFEGSEGGSMAAAAAAVPGEAGAGSGRLVQVRGGVESDASLAGGSSGKKGMAVVW